MNAAAANYVTLVEAFELKAPLEEVAPLITTMMDRLEREGVASLVSMQFYTSDVPGQLGAVIRFSSPEQFPDHLKMISGWEEFSRFASLIKLIDIRVYGHLSPEVEAWMRKFDGPLHKHESLIAGFVRKP